jgi:hypothetical protein
MGIRFACHLCNHPMNLKETQAGRRGVCPKCKGKFRIPIQSTHFSSPVSTTANEQESTVATGSDLFGKINDGSDLVVSKSELSAGRDKVKSVSAVVASTPSSIDKRHDGNSQRQESTEGSVQFWVRPPSGGEYGPATQDMLRDWAYQNRITPDTLVCKERENQWTMISDIFPDLFRHNYLSNLKPQPPKSKQLKKQSSLGSASSGPRQDRPIDHEAGGNMERLVRQMKKKNRNAAGQWFLFAGLFILAIFLGIAIWLVISRK